MKSVMRHVVATLSMIFGVVGVLSLVYYMNEINQPPTKEASAGSKAFHIEKTQKPPPKVVKKTSKSKKRTQRVQAIASPNIASAMSGLSFELPQFENAGLVGADQLLDAAGDSKRLVHTNDTVDVKPRPTSRKPPEYPPKARERGIEGFVLLNIKISERGSVENVRVMASEPQGVFDMVAVAAVHDWTFEPGQSKGQPVPVSMKQRIPFRLN